MQRILENLTHRVNFSNRPSAYVEAGSKETSEDVARVFTTTAGVDRLVRKMTVTLEVEVEVEVNETDALFAVYGEAGVEEARKVVEESDYGDPLHDLTSDDLDSCFASAAVQEAYKKVSQVEGVTVSDTSSPSIEENLGTLVPPLCEVGTRVDSYSGVGVVTEIKTGDLFWGGPPRHNGEPVEGIYDECCYVVTLEKGGKEQFDRSRIAPIG